MLLLSNVPYLNSFVKGGELYWAFPFSKGSLQQQTFHYITELFTAVIFIVQAPDRLHDLNLSLGVIFSTGVVVALTINIKLGW